MLPGTHLRPPRSYSSAWKYPSLLWKSAYVSDLLYHFNSWTNLNFAASSSAGFLYLTSLTWRYPAPYFGGLSRLFLIYRWNLCFAEGFGPWIRRSLTSYLRSWKTSLSPRMIDSHPPFGTFSYRNFVTQSFVIPRIEISFFWAVAFWKI